MSATVVPIRERPGPDTSRRSAPQAGQYRFVERQGAAHLGQARIIGQYNIVLQRLVTLPQHALQIYLEKPTPTLVT